MRMTDENIENNPTPEAQFEALRKQYEDRLPKNWDEMTRAAQLDWFGHRILLDLREEAGREASKDWGFLSDYQLERRRRREVQSKLNGWDDIPPRQGVFRRTYVDKNRLLINREDNKPQDGQKN
jgi:hypothetical protein